MEFTKHDLNQIKNILSILNRSKIELNGAQEAVSYAESYKWLAKMASIVSEELTKAENTPPPAEPAPEQPAPKRARR